MPNLYDVTTEPLRQDMIEVLIRHNRPTATEIAAYLDWYYEDVVEMLEQLRDEGLVCNLVGEEPGDVFGDYETQGTNEVIQHVHWRWCGGPVSEALRVA
jgi:hypothetical protein